ALLIVVGRHRRLIETDQQQERGRARQPRQHTRRQRQEFGGIGEVDQRHGILIVVSGGAGNAAWFVSCRLREKLIGVKSSSVEAVPQAGRGGERSDHQ